MMKGMHVLLGVLILSALTACRSNSSIVIETPIKTTDGIETASIAEVNLDAKSISDLVNSIRSGYYPNRHSLLIYKDDKLVLEQYFSGRDNLWGSDIGIVNHNDSTLHDVRSISKSIVSACVGIAIEQGKIKTVNAKVFDYFKEYDSLKVGGKENLTIKHLLTMSSGLEWNENLSYDNPANSEIQMDQSKDGIGFVLSRRLVSVPGTKWNYNGGTTALLAEIIRRVSGQNIHEFAKQHLLSRMGITRSEWTNSTGTNVPAAASGLRLRSRDLLKFGILYMNDGKWEGQQIISADWIKESFVSHIARPDGGGYGYQFWILEENLGGKTMQWPTAVGNGDQRLFFDKKNRLLVAITAGNYNQFDIKNNSFAILTKLYSSFNIKE